MYAIRSYYDFPVALARAHRAQALPDVGGVPVAQLRKRLCTGVRVRAFLPQMRKRMVPAGRGGESYNFV